MRQIFTSPRLENVESAARLLNEQGIETYISNPRSYKGNRRGTYSYTDLARGEGGKQSAVWVVHSRDFGRARDLLHAAGLIESTRRESFLPEHARPVEQVGANPWPFRLRLALLSAIAIAALLVFARIW